MIGGHAPSAYLKKIQEHKQVQVDDGGMDQIFASHLIGAQQLRIDDCDALYEARKLALVVLVERAMKKSASAQTSEIAAAFDESVEECEPAAGQS